MKKSLTRLTRPGHPLGFSTLVLVKMGTIYEILRMRGFVYESFRNETNRVIRKKNFHETNLSKTNPRNESFKNESTKRIFQKRIHETNPRYESLRFGVTNPDSQIRILRIRKDSDSRIFIFKDSFCAIVLRIRKDL